VIVLKENVQLTLPMQPLVEYTSNHDIANYMFFYKYMKYGIRLGCVEQFQISSRKLCLAYAISR